MRALVALLCLVAGAAPAAARPLAVSDLLRLREVQNAFASPDGRHLVLAVSRPYGSAPAFDNETALSMSLGRLRVIDLDRRGQAYVIAPEDGTGYVAAPFSPSGRLMAVGRWRGGRLNLGILTLRTRRIRWLGLELVPPGAGRTLIWRSEREILLLSPRPGVVADALRDGAWTYGAVNRLWERQRRGSEPSTTVIGSGRFATDTARRIVRLMRLDLRSGASRLLAEGAFDDMELSSSGHFVALTAPGRDLNLGNHRVLNFSDVTPSRRLSIVDLQSGRRSDPCPSCDLTASLLSWSPERDRCLIFARTQDDETWEEGRFMIVDPTSGIVRSLDMPGLAPTVTPFGSEQFALTPAAWHGGEPLVWAHPVSALRSDWYAVKPDGLENLTATLAHPSAHLGRASDGALVFKDASASMRVPNPLSRAATPASPAPASLPGAGLRALLAPEGVLSVAADGRSDRGGLGAAVLARGADWRLLSRTDPHGVIAIDLERFSHVRRLLQLNAFLAAVEPAAARRLTHIAPDGSTQSDWLYLPPHATAPAPLVVIPYPGAVRQDASAAFAAGSFLPGPNPQWLAGQGFATLVPGTPRDPSSVDPAEGLVENVSAAVSAAVATHRVDGRRIGVWGHSFGGWAALTLGERDPRIRAVIAESGPSDLISLRGVFPAPVRVALDDTRRREVMVGWSEAGQGHLMGAPWQEPLRYLQNSPAVHADRMQAPVLILFGDQDFLDLGQGEEMFSALKRLGKDARLVTFWGEGHIVQSPANLKSLYGEVGDFLSRTLLSATPAPRSAMSSNDEPTLRSP